MEQNETKIISNTNRLKTNFIKLKNVESKANTTRKFYLSRNSFLKNKNKTLYNFGKYNIGILSNNYSKDIPYKKEELFKNEMNSISYRKSLLANSVQFDVNFLSRLSEKKNINKIISSKTIDVKNYENIIRLLNVIPNKKRKIDFLKYKYLLGQKNYYKRLFEQDDFSFSTYYSKKINPYLRKKPKKYYFNVEEFKKIFAEQDDMCIYSMRDWHKNFSISSLKHLNNNLPKKNNCKINNLYTTIKIRKNNIPNILRRTNEIIDDDKNVIIKKNDYLIKKLNENKKNKINQENKELDKSPEKEKIIYDNYNKYINNISSSESNKSQNAIKNININNKSHRVLVISLRSLKNKFFLNDRNKMNQYGKRINNNNSSIMINNNKKFLKLKNIISNRKKEDINKSIIIGNAVLRKKIISKNNSY